jgi:hypothetical protein
VADHAAHAAAQLQADLGIWVVFPEPVSPATITTWWSRMAAAIVLAARADGELGRVGDRGDAARRAAIACSAASTALRDGRERLARGPAVAVGAAVGEAAGDAVLVDEGEAGGARPARPPRPWRR